MSFISPTGSSIPFQYAGLVGATPGISRVVATGKTKVTSLANIPQDVWQGAEAGTPLIPFPTTALPLEVVSNSPNDIVGGAGARVVLVVYLNADWRARSFVAPMNGLTPVPIPEPVMRINRLVVITSGNPRAANVGAIQARPQGGGNPIAYIGAPDFPGQPMGLSKSCQYSVPRGFVLDLLGIFCTIRSGSPTEQRATPVLMFRVPQSSAPSEGVEIPVSTNAPYFLDVHSAPILTMPETSDAWVTVFEVSNTGSTISAGFIGLLRPSDPTVLN